MADCVQLLVIPELADTPWNAPLRLFSPDPKVREQAIVQLHQMGTDAAQYAL